MSRAQTLADRAAATGRTAKEARATLDRQVLERYAVTLPELEAEVETLSARVEGHLKKMGVAW